MPRLPLPRSSPPQPPLRPRQREAWTVSDQTAVPNEIPGKFQGKVRNLFAKKCPKRVTRVAHVARPPGLRAPARELRARAPSLHAAMVADTSPVCSSRFSASCEGFWSSGAFAASAIMFVYRGTDSF